MFEKYYSYNLCFYVDVNQRLLMTTSTTNHIISAFNPAPPLETRKFFCFGRKEFLDLLWKLEWPLSKDWKPVHSQSSKFDDFRKEIVWEKIKFLPIPQNIIEHVLLDYLCPWVSREPELPQNISTIAQSQNSFLHSLSYQLSPLYESMFCLLKPEKINGEPTHLAILEIAKKIFGSSFDCDEDYISSMQNRTQPSPSQWILMGTYKSSRHWTIADCALRARIEILQKRQMDFIVRGFQPATSLDLLIATVAQFAIYDFFNSSSRQKMSQDKFWGWGDIGKDVMLMHADRIHNGKAIGLNVCFSTKTLQLLARDSLCTRPSCLILTRALK